MKFQMGRYHMKKVIKLKQYEKEWAIIKWGPKFEILSVITEANKFHAEIWEEEWFQTV